MMATGEPVRACELTACPPALRHALPPRPTGIAFFASPVHTPPVPRALCDPLGVACSLLSRCLAAGKLPGNAPGAPAAAVAAVAALRAAVRVARAMRVDGVAGRRHVDAASRAAMAASRAAAAPVASVAAAVPWQEVAAVPADGGCGPPEASEVDFLCVAGCVSARACGVCCRAVERCSSVCARLHLTNTRL